MFKFFTKRFNNKKGFTLVELIVVIAILGILVAIAVPKIGGFRVGVAKRAHNANVKMLEGAANMYLTEYGIGTHTETTWEPDAGGKTSGLENENFNNEKPKNMWAKYIAEWPEVPEGLKNGNGEEVAETKYKIEITKKGDITITPKEISGATSE